MLPSRIIPYALFLIILLSVPLAGHAQRPKGPARSRAGVAAAAQTPEATRRLETFQKVWQTINDYYFDKTPDKEILAAPVAAPPPVSRKVLGEVTVKPPPPARGFVTKTKDPNELKVIEDFIRLTGGREAIAKLDTYEVSGKAELTVRGTGHEFDYGAFKKSSDKYSEILSTPGVGEIREVFNGRTHLTQADYGLVDEIPVPWATNVSQVGIFGYLKLLADETAFDSLRYGGTYERDGRRVHLIDAESKTGSSIAFAFDVENKTLTYFAGPAHGIIFGEYRKVGDMLLPFSVERERLMKLKLDAIKLNQPIDDSKFTKKINCYDVPN